MRGAAIVVSLWLALRWAGWLLGLVRVRRFAGPTRSEALRAVVVRFAANVVLSLVPFYLWVSIAGLVPTPVLIGTVAGFVSFSVVAGAMAAFMQPAERTSETLDLFRLIPNPWEAYEQDSEPTADTEG